MRRGISLFLVLVLVVTLFSGIPATASGWALAGDGTGWTVAYPANNQNDYLQDQQTGSGSVS